MIILARPSLLACHLVTALALLTLVACSKPRGERWDSGLDAEGGTGDEILCGGDPADDSACVIAESSDVFLQCELEGEFFRVTEINCTATGRVCVELPPYDSCDTMQAIEGQPYIGCAVCRPCSLGCLDGDVAQCLPDGSGWEVVQECYAPAGEACEDGRCVNGCEVAISRRSNVGCEYYAVDLDNAVDHGLSAAAQQFAVVVSNPSLHAEAYVEVEICHAQPCSDEANREVIADATVNRRDLEVFELEPREVDGSAPGTFGTGPGTALGPLAFRVTSTWPIIAYQFNPLENFGVFSNDASLLLPASAIDTRYTVLSWPQTIAKAPGDSEVDSEQDFPAYLTIIGVEDGTTVTVETTADIVPSGEDPPLVPFTARGETLELTINAFDVLNLETGFYEGVSSFGADFTGTIVESSAAVAVFAGVEATDVPAWESRGERQAAADHLEQQQWPERSFGFSYVVAHTPRRTQALSSAGAPVTPLSAEPEWFRIMAVRDDTVVETTLPGHEVIELRAREYVTLESDTHFHISSNTPISVGQFVGGQSTAGITIDLPGGDPAFILVPPIEQWREGYVFLTPDKYMFDYLMIAVSRAQASLVELDGVDVATIPSCWRERADGLPPDDPELPDYYVITCALSAPEWDAEQGEVVPGEQSDIPHEVYVRGTGPGVGITVYGFDRYVSYGYAGGTDLELIQ